MADIKRYTDNIRKAIYGKEVRESLATGIEVINTEVEENTKHVNETITDIKNFKNDINLAEQQRISAENKRISDESTRVSNEEHRKETFRQIVDENSTWDSKLTNLYNNNNSELNDLKNSFKSKYDNLEAEYANDIHDIKNKYISRYPKRIDPSKDLNTVTLGGNYIVAEAKNAPYNYGRLVVLAWDNANWCTQIFYSDIRNEVFTRCSTNAEATSWTSWQKLVTTNDADNKYAAKDDVLNSKFSDPLITDDSKIVTVGKGSVNTGGSYVTKDFRNQMKRSIVTLTNIAGQSMIKNRKFWDINLSNMATYKPSDVLEIFKQPVLNNYQSYYDVVNNNTKLNVKSSSSEYGYVQYKLVVKPYTDYMLCFDVEEATGTSWVAVSTSSDGSKGVDVICDITYEEGKTSTIFNSGQYSIIYVRFYANVKLMQANKEVSYLNAKLIKARDYYSGNLVLRSLPNGVSDELRDGKPIIRVGKYTLNGYEDWSIVDSSKPNTNCFICHLPDAIRNPDKTSICIRNNVYESTSDSDLYGADRICMAMGGDEGQLVFRVSKGIDSVEALKYHLQHNEKDLTVYYEITPRTYVMDSANKLDNVAIGLIAETGDELHLGTPLTPIAPSHRVQLTTQAQIQELQNDVSEVRKSFWGKLKGLLDVKFYVGQNGYIKLPKIFGGFLIQWGRTLLKFNGNQVINVDVNFPITFPEDVFHMSCNSFPAHNAILDMISYVTWKNNNTATIRAKCITGATDMQPFISWIAIGR